eukprot:6492522-Amphidinium_carterae.2
MEPDLLQAIAIENIGHTWQCPHPRTCRVFNRHQNATTTTVVDNISCKGVQLICRCYALRFNVIQTRHPLRI